MSLRNPPHDFHHSVRHCRTFRVNHIHADSLIYESNTKTSRSARISMRKINPGGGGEDRCILCLISACIRSVSSRSFFDKPYRSGGGKRQGESASKHQDAGVLRCRVLVFRIHSLGLPPPSLSFPSLTSSHRNPLHHHPPRKNPDSHRPSLPPLRLFHLPPTA
jgi:hypothetical protein